jgi:hypothetical protein
MLAVLNIAFFVFHTSLIVFNVFGWMFKRTRKWNLLCLIVTLAGWTVLGIWYGVGYCFCTDWHWQVREAMGIHETADSYIVLLTRNLSGWDPPVSIANAAAMWTFIFALSMSTWLNLWDWRKAERASSDARS